MALTSTSSSPSRSSSILDDPSNPLYLHHEESPSAMLVFQTLVGENYPTWERSMRMALIAKNKLEFIDGTLTLSSPLVKTSTAIQAWIRCDKMVTSWVLNSISQEIATSIVDKDTALEIWNGLRERLSQANGARIFQLQKDIAGITQGQSSITSYFTQLNMLWDQLQKFRPFPMCSCGYCTCNLGQKLNDLQHQDLVMQFLMGLNDSYAQVRAQILLMDPLPPINKVYSLLIQEERRCSVGNNSSPHVESSTPVTKLSSSSGNKNNKSSKGKEKLTSNHCGMNGDTVEKNSTSTSTSLTFTQEQCQLFLAMLGTYSTSMAEFVANNSELGSPTISEERIPSLVEYSFTPLAKLESVSSVLNGANPIPANNTYTDANGARSLSISLLFPPPMSEIETDDSCSESNEAPHAAAQFSNSVLNGTNPIPTNNSNTDANGARSLSISFLFPPPMSEIETDDSCSESNETPRAAAQFSYSISSCFPPGRSETDSSSEIYEIIPVDPSSTANPGCTANFEEILKPKSSNSSKSNRTPLKFSHSKINSILSLFFAAKSRTNSSKRPRHTILPTRFKGVEYGTLSGHLHNPKSTSLMSWAARIKVALDIARGIEFLHVYAVPSIIHRNIKPSNIFLDATLTAKLSNFNRSMNASKWCDHVINKAIGIDGGIDPEFRSTLHLTTRVDVYSFGKVLLEMLSGSKQFHVTNIYEEERCLVKFVAPYIAQEKIHKFLDPKVPPPTPLEMEALANVATLALDCVSIQSVLHPSMTKVANTIQSTLEGILEGQVIPYNSIACSCESISDAESEIIIDVDIGSFGV